MRGVRAASAASTPQAPVPRRTASSLMIGAARSTLAELPNARRFAVTRLPGVLVTRYLGDSAEEARAGFVRARIDGRVHELDALPKLDPRRKHSIEAVVDRFRVRPDAAQRYVIIASLAVEMRTTSAPMSAMICVQYGPITTEVTSTTRMP